MKILFATDIHGSERCFRKFLNSIPVHKPDILILGGDITGKVLVPIVRSGSGWSTYISGKQQQLSTEAEKAEAVKLITMSGQYPIEVTDEEKRALDADPAALDATFRRAMVTTLEGWVDLAADRAGRSGVPVYMMPGNDDSRDVETVLAHAEYVQSAEGRVLELPGGYSLVSFGYSNRTPWDSPRELDDEELGIRLREVMKGVDPSSAIVNFHVPPYGTNLDEAPALDSNLRLITKGGQPAVTHVGSHSVRALIEEMQPLLGLHGHIHESRAVEKLGRTVCVNPGSEYGTGTLKFAIVEIKKDQVARWQLLNG
jgi:Icc-related predicted phosphoesterase